MRLRGLKRKTHFTHRDDLFLSAIAHYTFAGASRSSGVGAPQLPRRAECDHRPGIQRAASLFAFPEECFCLRRSRQTRRRGTPECSLSRLRLVIPPRRLCDPATKSHPAQRVGSGAADGKAPVTLRKQVVARDQARPRKLVAETCTQQPPLLTHGPWNG